ncbi:hypothetical protein [Paracoccus thiocyanatus]|uniref:hypothetical protein n=1 Tax=Paracoccus thiocyanatus TaxID=34006 RepID=UPI0015F24B3D|nr:hypothetical protein [Paracoccus thiocyanatus]
MKPLASLERLIKADEPETYAESLSYTVEALIATARLALDNETSGSDLRDRTSYVVEETLAVALSDDPRAENRGIAKIAGGRMSVATAFF